MKKIKSYKKWGIYQNNAKEIAEYGFKITLLHPDNMECPYACTPADSDWEVDTMEQALEWIDNY